MISIRTVRGASAGVLACLLASVVLSARDSLPVQAASTCNTTTTSTYSVQVCISAPQPNATLTGQATVTGTSAMLAGSVRVTRLVYNLDTNYLISDFQTPYSYHLSTAHFVDGQHSLSAYAFLSDSSDTSTNPVIETVNFSNGVTTPPVNNNSPVITSGTTPAPGAPFVVAAVGDGAGGETAATSVANAISTWNPNLFLYLGDVYEKGSYAEFDNWYNDTFGRFRSITDPVIGNHEYGTRRADGYFGYWNNEPNYYSFDAGGWHFIALNSTSQFQATGWNQQLAWLANDLSTHAGACTIAFWHHPLFNIGPEGASARVQDLWTPLVNARATLVLNGHDHTYQRWQPLGAGGTPSPSGLTEVISGTGGHSAQTLGAPDPRLAFGASKVYGALQLSLTPYSARLQYFTVAGGTSTLADSTTVPCNGFGRLSGTVTDAFTGAPLPGAIVSYGSASTTSDSSGHYTFNQAALGSSSLSVSAGGYAPQSAAVTVSPGSDQARSFAVSPLPASVGGAVTDAVTGLPIPGVTVAFAGGSTSTDGQGAYAFSSVNEGSYTLTVSAPSYVTQQTQLEVPPGASLSRSFALNLVPGSVDGTVSDAQSGAPIQGATISVAGNTVTTAVDGGYALSQVPAGAQSISASAIGYAPITNQITLPPGGTVTSNFRLTLVPESVSGTVTDAVSGLPVPGASVSYTGGSTTTDANGGYSLTNLPVGSTALTASAPLFNPSTATVTLVAGGSATANFSLTPLPAAIQGTVRDQSTGLPLFGATVALAGGSASTDQSGSYTLTQVTEGSYQVTASATGYASRNTGVTVGPGQTLLLDFSLTPLPGTVHGVVSDVVTGSPIAAATVAVETLTATSALDGSYSIAGLAAGTYTVQVTANHYQTATTAVAVGPGAAVNADFALIPLPGTISGRAGDVLTGLAIGVVDVAFPGFDLLTDSGGLYSFTGVTEGTYQVTATKAGYTAQTLGVTVGPGATVVLNFALDPLPGSLSGIVTDLGTNLPLAGAIVSYSAGFATTDSAGRYVLNGIVEGTITFTAGATGYSQTSQTMTIAPGSSNTGNFAIIRPLFADGFESGSLSAWNQAGTLTAESRVAHGGSYGAEGSTPTGATYVRENLGGSYADLYYRTYFQVVSAPTVTASLIGFRSGSASLIRLYVDSKGRLGLRNDFGNVSLLGPTIGAGWHSVEMHVIVNGTSSTIEVWLDGVPVIQFATQSGNLGTGLVTQIQLGENQTGRAYDIVFDDVVVQAARIGP